MSETIGERIRRLRGRVLTQRELADRAGISIETVRALEQGKRETASVTTLAAIARALDVDLALLVGKPGALPPGNEDSGIVAIRESLMPVDDLTGVTFDTAEPLTIREAERAVTYMWGAYWAGKYDDLGAIVPQSLAQLRATHHAAKQTDQREAAELLARGYWVTGCTLVHMGQTDSAYMAIRQALDAASAGGDELLHATLRGSVAWQLLVQGRYEESERIAIRSAQDIAPSGDVPLPHLSAYGSLVLQGATAAGRGQNRSGAYTYISESHEVAARTGDRSDYETAFGPSQVVMQSVDVNVVTQNYDEALKTARDMPPGDALPLASRARHLADRALALARTGEAQKALDSLLTAERIGPDWIRYQTLPRQIVSELLDQEARKPLRTFAQRLGVA